MTIAVDRRTTVRHTPAEYDTYVRIMDWTGKRITRARLVNVSTRGALIFTDSVVATSQKLRVQLERAPDTGWIEAEAVHFGRLQGVGITFMSACGPEFLLAATRGGSSRLANPTEEATPRVGDVRVL